MTNVQIIKDLETILINTLQDKRAGKYDAFQIAAFMRDFGAEMLENIKIELESRNMQEVRR